MYTYLDMVIKLKPMSGLWATLHLPKPRDYKSLTKTRTRRLVRDEWTRCVWCQSSASTLEGPNHTRTSNAQPPNPSGSSSSRPIHDPTVLPQPVTLPTAGPALLPTKSTLIQSGSSDILQNAWQKLSDDHRVILTPYIPSTAIDASEAIERSLAEAKNKQRQCDEKRWKFKFAQRTIVLKDVAGKVAQWLDHFKDVGDIVAGIDPIHVGLPWAGFRFVLEIAISEEKQMASLLVGCEMALYVINRLKVYIKFLENVPSSISRTNFEAGLVQLYALVLSFLAQAIKVYQQSAAKRTFASLWQNSDVQDFEQECDKIANRLEIEAKNCDRTLDNEDRMTLQQLQETLERVEQDHRVQASLEQLTAKTDLSNLKLVETAAFNAYGQDHQECHTNTRVDLLNNIQDWASSPNSQSILWLQAMAGTGKSTISYTFAKWLSKRGQSDGVDLGATFFFKRGESDRGSAALLFPTIVHQLTRKVPGLGTLIAKAVGDNPDICGKALGEQFDTLISGPFKELQVDASNKIHIVVIDALDECIMRDASTVMQLWCKLVEKCPVHLRLFVTSRPEIPIQNLFRQLSSNAFQEIVLHDVDSAQVRQDILIFLDSRFTEIRSKYDHRSLGAEPLDDNWPGPKILQELADMAVPLFIVASTICLFVDEYGEIPTEQLDIILHSTRQEGYISQMGRIYLPILKHLENPSKGRRYQNEVYADFRTIIGSIITVAEPLSKAALASLLNFAVTSIGKRLQPLSSVIYIPNDITTPVRRLHLSFGEFLTSEDIVNEPFYINSAATHEMLLSKCIKLLSRPSPEGLHENMCHLSFPGQLRQETTWESIQLHLAPAVQYACEYWTYHALNSATKIIDQDEIHMFLQKHFLHWLEVLSLLNCMTDVIMHIENLRSLVSPLDSVDVIAFLDDARRFVLSFRYIADLAPLQLYSSAIAFAPQESIIKRLCGPIPPWILRDVVVPRTWGPELQQLEDYNVVNGMALSPVGDLVASAAFNGTIRLWDIRTGLEAQKLNHGNDIVALTFSPDGSQLASASQGAIQLWNVYTGQEMQRIENHEYPITAIAFSSNGTQLASAHYWETVRLWDAKTGKVIHDEEPEILSEDVQLKDKTGSLQTAQDGFDSGTQKLRKEIKKSEHSKEEQAKQEEMRKTEDLMEEDESEYLEDLEEEIRKPLFACDPFWSVAFSPDSHRLALGSDDGTVRLWNVNTWQEIHKTKRNDGVVLSVVFSPGGNLLASTSDDGTIRLWDVKKWQEVQTLGQPTVYKESILMAAFSPDGDYLASAHEDRALRLWDTKTWQEIKRLEGHNGHITGLAFSPDSRLLASASFDQTIRFWDFRLEQEAQQLEKHTHVIKTVRFSPDGSQLVSTSWDQTVWLWDVATGRAVKQLAHNSEALDTTFSPDGSQLAIIHEDDTVRLCNAKTGQELHELKHDTEFAEVVFSPDGCLLALASMDDVVHLWDVATGRIVQKLEHTESKISVVAFSPDGSQLASSGQQTIHFWDLVTGQVIRTLKQDEVVTMMAFSPDGSQLVSVTPDHKIWVWDLELERQIQMWESYKRIRDIRFGPDGLTLLTDNARIPINTIPRLIGTGEIKASQNLDIGDEEIEFGDKKLLEIVDDWIEVDEKKLLWLPPAYRTNISAIYGDILALGRPDGIVTFLEICYR